MGKTTQKLKDALKNIEEANTLRATAKELEDSPCNDPLGAKFMRMDADELEAKAQQALQIPVEALPSIGTGGELTISKECAVESPSLVNTVEKPVQNVMGKRLELKGGLEIYLEGLKRKKPPGSSPRRLF